MITFRNDDVRTKFHTLPAEDQLFWEHSALRLFNKRYQIMRIEDIFVDGRVSEIIIRIVEQPHLHGPAA